MHIIQTAAVAAIFTAGLGLSACASDALDNDVVRGAAIGGAGGAAVGAVVPGVSTAEGAAIGAAGGAVIGALDKDRKCYRDSDGREYYIDRDGRRVYTNC